MSGKPMLTETKYGGGRSTLEAEMHQLNLSPEMIRYCQTISRRYQNPIVELRAGVCTGCWMALSTAKRQDIETGDGNDICEHCGRIIFYEEV